MANHKRKRPKSRRAGCLFCKPHKHQRAAKVPRSKRAQTAEPAPPVHVAVADMADELDLDEYDQYDIDWGEAQQFYEGWCEGEVTARIPFPPALQASRLGREIELLLR